MKSRIFFWTTFLCITLAAVFVLAVTAHRKIGVMRNRREELQVVFRAGRSHLGLVFPGEHRPLGG